MEAITINSIALSGHVIAINEYRSGDKHVANCLLQEFNGGKPMTYKATFWGDEADYVLGHVTKGDQIALTGYANQIIEAAKGPYLEILNCELNYIEPLMRIPVEGIKSLRKKEVDTNGTVS